MLQISQWVQKLEEGCKGQVTFQESMLTQLKHVKVSVARTTAPVFEVTMATVCVPPKGRAPRQSGQAAQKSSSRVGKVRGDG